MNVKVLLVGIVVALMGLLVIPAAADDSALILPVGQAVNQAVSLNDLNNTYKFTAKPNESIFLLAVSQDYEKAPSITISRDETNENIATVKHAVSGMCLRIAPGTDSYTMSIAADYSAAGSQGIQGYGLMLVPGDPNAMNCPNDEMNSLSNFTASASLLDTDGINVPVSTLGGGTIVIDGPIDPGHSTCSATPGVNIGVNVRLAPNLTSGILNNVHVGSMVPVLGSVANADWLLVNLNGVLGFVSSSVLNVTGNCTNVPVVTPPGGNNGGTVTVPGGGIDIGATVPGIIDAGVHVGGDGVNVDASVPALGTDANVNLGNDGLHIDANVDPLGTNANVDLDNNGLNVDANVDPLNTNANVDLNNNGLNVGVNTPIIQATVTVGGTGTGTGTGSGSGSNNQGSGICVNLLGIHIAC